MSTQGAAGLEPTTDHRRASASLTTHAVWLLVAKTVGFALSIALPMLLVRRLTQVEFGLYKQVFFIVATAINVLPLGFGMSAFYFLPRERERQGAVIVNIVAFHAAIGLVVSLLLLIWPGLLVRLFNNPALAPVAGWVGVLVLLWTVASFLEIVTVAAQDVRATTGFIVTSQLSKTLLLVLAAWIVGTVNAMIAAGILQGVLQIALMLWYLHGRFPGFWRAFDGRLLRTQAAYTLPLGGANLVLKLQDDLHHYFVSYAFGPAAYALYAVGVFKLPLLGILRESVGSVILPRINELEKDNEPRRILQLVAATARKLSLAYYPLYVFMLVTGPEVITILFTRQYIDSFPILAMSLSIIPLSVIVLEPVTRAASERFFILRMRMALLAALTLALWFFSRELGLFGIITAVTLAKAIGWVIAASRMARLLQVRARDLRLFADVGRIAGCATAAGLAAAAVRAWPLAGEPAWLVVVVCGLVFAAVYGVTIVQGGVMKPAELHALWNEATRLWARPSTAKGPMAVPDRLRSAGGLTGGPTTT